MKALICSLATVAAFGIGPLRAQYVVAPPAAPLPGEGGPATAAAVTPGGVAVDKAGNVFIADYGNDSVREVAIETGIITTVARGVFTAGSETGIAVDGDGNVFVADAQAGQIRKIAAGTRAVTTITAGYNGYSNVGFAGDGGPVSGAQMDHPYGVTVDALGNIFVADWGNNRVRKIAAGTGIINTIAGDGSVDFTGDGGPAIAAGLPNPSSVAVDAAGNVFIAEWGNDRVNRVREVAAESGIITTFAGTGDAFPVGDGGLATQAGLSPYGVAVDGAGNILIADIEADRIRRVAVATGIITTIAGNDSDGHFAGDGGPATSAALNTPLGVAVDAAGNVFVADAHNNRVRKIAAGTGIITTIAGDGTPSWVPPRRRAIGSD